VGAIGIYVKRCGPFLDSQIKLVTNFAAQASSPSRKYSPAQGLRESLQQQTATADVLKVHQPIDLRLGLCSIRSFSPRHDCADATAHSYTGLEGAPLTWPPVTVFSEQFRQFIKDHRSRRRGTLTGRVVLEGHMVHIPDVLARSGIYWTEAIKLGVDFRTMLGIPLCAKGTLIGYSTDRSTVRPFTDKQIELVKHLADRP